MNVRMKFLPILCVTLIGGCGQVSNDAFETSRFDTSHVAIADVTRSDKAMAEQAELLNDMAKGIVRASTRRGAAISATFGCGLALVAASAAKDCVAGALVGAAGGALVGNAAGKKELARRIEVVSPSDVVRSISRTKDQLRSVQATLPAHLAKQDTELATLKAALGRGAISQEAFEKRLGEIRDNRAQLAQALMQSENETRTAAQNLSAAATKGQTGLDWHILSTKKIEEDAFSTRSSITLL